MRYAKRWGNLIIIPSFQYYESERALESYCHCASSSICAVIERGCSLTCSLTRVWKLSTRSLCVSFCSYESIQSTACGLKLCCVLGGQHMLTCRRSHHTRLFEAYEECPFSELWKAYWSVEPVLDINWEALFILARRPVCSGGHILLDAAPGSYCEAWFGHVLSPFWRQLTCKGHLYLHRGEPWVDSPVLTVCLKSDIILLVLPAFHSESPFPFFSFSFFPLFLCRCFYSMSHH